MSQIVRDGDRLVLQLTDEVVSSWKGINLQLLSPLLLGLMVPFIAINYFDPDAMRQLKTPIFIFLVFMFLICTGLFFYTAHFPGSIHSISVHRDERQVEITWFSMLATSSQMVPFSEIAALRVRNSYDDDGYATAVGELVLRSQRTIQLPEGTTEEQLRPMRAAIGLG